MSRNELLLIYCDIRGAAARSCIGRNAAAEMIYSAIDVTSECRPPDCTIKITISDTSTRQFHNDSHVFSSPPSLAGLIAINCSCDLHANSNFNVFEIFIAEVEFDREIETIGEKI
jgi:hypothetical protein